MRSMHYCLVVNWNCAGSPTDCHRSEKKRSRQQAAIYGPTERCQMSCFRTLRRTLSNVPRKFRYSSSSTPSNICSSMGRRHVEILQLLRDVGVPPRHDAIHQVRSEVVEPDLTQAWVKFFVSHIVPQQASGKPIRHYCSYDPNLLFHSDRNLASFATETTAYFFGISAVAIAATAATTANTEKFHCGPTLRLAM